MLAHSCTQYFFRGKSAKEQLLPGAEVVAPSQTNFPYLTKQIESMTDEMNPSFSIRGEKKTKSAAG